MNDEPIECVLNGVNDLIKLTFHTCERNVKICLCLTCEPMSVRMDLYVSIINRPRHTSPPTTSHRAAARQACSYRPHHHHPTKTASEVHQDPASRSLADAFHQ